MAYDTWLIRAECDLRPKNLMHVLFDVGHSRCGVCGRGEGELRYMISDITAPSIQAPLYLYLMVPRLLMGGCDGTISLFTRGGKRN